MTPSQRPADAPAPPSAADTLDLHISDPVSMLNEIARRYESTERILMEYVDNALDDAERLYREHGNCYPYPVRIELEVDAAAQTVIIRDNCHGMSREVLERIIRNVGESQKRGLSWVNGRFGFGVQAFRAAARSIRFQTRRADGPQLALELERSQHTGITGARETTEAFPFATGTQVVLRGFEDEWFEDVTTGSIKAEIESHFERLLARPGLDITVGDRGDEPLRCEPFRYRDVPGTDIRHTLRLAVDEQAYQVDVHLKVADFEVPGRNVRFFARGRRVNYVSEFKSFIRKSAYRTSVWGHPHLLGYIEVGEIVRPVITRDDFVRNKGRNVFYDAVLALEPGIKRRLDRVNEAQRDHTLSRLEDVLRHVLDDLARQDRRLLRLHLATAGNGHRNGNGGPGSGVNGGAEPGAAADARRQLPGSGLAADLADDGRAPDLARRGRPAELTGPADGVELRYAPSVRAPRHGHRFDIQFFDIPPDASGQVKRSYLVDATIYINVAHPDFQERMSYSRRGQPRVTERLGAYIAGAVSIHYKDQYYSRYGSMPDRRDLLFDEQLQFICRLEAALRDHLPALEKELGRQTGT